ncbi:hypothetical protein V9K67_17200 [Paraflavisolibacter sp. H34]|uniref:hypothetical protein n=1 Tax=Huijunlia imazamoxiresistens TaxID=3127457 RepID=UPI003019DF4D
MEQVIAGGFDEFGFPFLELQVRHQKKGLSADARAILDTGAAHCLVREEIAFKLGLEELREADYRHPVFGKLLLKEYLMDLGFGNGLVIEGIRAGTLLDPHYPADVVIGVEVLRHCRLSYDGPAQTFQLVLDL